jgi:hypothetical protein
MSSDQQMTTQDVEIHDTPGEVVPIQPTFTLADVQNMNPADLTPEQKRNAPADTTECPGLQNPSKADPKRRQQA